MGINPVAQYQPSDCTSQTGTAYKTQIDANSRAAQRIAARFAPHAQANPNMSVMVDPASVFDGITLTEIGAQSTALITAPVSHPRIDRVVIDNLTGAVSVVSGAEAVSPVPPAIPNGKSPVAQVLLQTSTAAITNAIITDERNFSSLSVGGFGAQTAIGSAATCDLGTVLSRNAKITGTTAITSFGASANTQNPIYQIEFTGALALTAGAGLLLPGSATINTAAGDTAVAEYLGSGNWRVRSYHRVDGSPTLPISGLLDEVSSAVGSILYRGASGWVALPPAPSDGAYIQQSGGVPQWAAVPAGGMVAIQTQDIANVPTVLFTGIDGTYDEYVFELIDIVCTAGNFCLRTSADGGTTIDASSSYLNSYVYGANGSVTHYGSSPSYGIIYPGQVSLLNGTIKLPQPANTTSKKMLDVQTRSVTQANSYLAVASGVIYKASSAAAINAIQFLTSAGNITSGRITLYGIKHA